MNDDLPKTLWATAGKRRANPYFEADVPALPEVRVEPMATGVALDAVMRARPGGGEP